MKLPLVMYSTKTRILYYVIGISSTLLLYQFSNRVHFFVPKLLPMQTLDQSAPFLPWTVWVYFSEYIIFLIPVFGLKDCVNLTKYFYSYMFILLFSVTIFILYPITFPRELFPLDTYPDGATKFMFLWLRNQMDTPANCIPSLHVSSCYVSAFPFWRENKKIFWILTFWSTLVAISTLTTKQHYFIDIWTALLLTSAAYLFFSYKIEYVVDYK